MEEIIRSRNPMILLTVGAGLFAIGSLFRVIAYAMFTASSPGNIDTFRNLGHASDWSHFAGALAALAGVSLAGWDLIPKKRIVDVVEVAAATLATLLITIGSLVEAASSSSLSAANVVVAIGIGVWALLALSRAARHNLAEQQAPGTGPSMVPLWLTVCAGLVVFAVGSGLTVKVTDQGLGIAAGLLEAIGLALLVQPIVLARSRGMLATAPVPAVIAGLVMAAVGFVVYAIVAGIVFTPSGTLTGLRVGIGLTNFILMVGVAVLGSAAWIRVGELVAGHPRQPVPRREGWSFRGWPSGGSGQEAPGPPPPVPAPGVVPSGEDVVPSGEDVVPSGVGPAPGEAAAARPAEADDTANLALTDPTVPMPQSPGGTPAPQPEVTPVEAVEAVEPPEGEATPEQPAASEGEHQPAPPHIASPPPPPPPPP